jgi:hypothetical protein
MSTCVTVTGTRVASVLTYVTQVTANQTARLQSRIITGWLTTMVPPVGPMRAVYARTFVPQVTVTLMVRLPFRITIGWLTTMVPLAVSSDLR